MIRDGLDWLGAGVALLLTGVFFVALLGSGLVSHQACVERYTGDVSHGGWEVNPLAWFGVATVSEDEICESETGTQYLGGKVPLVGESFERMAGGPQNPAYYQNR